MLMMGWVGKLLLLLLLSKGEIFSLCYGNDLTHVRNARIRVQYTTHSLILKAIGRRTSKAFLWPIFQIGSCQSVAQGIFALLSPAWLMTYGSIRSLSPRPHLYKSWTQQKN